LLTSSPNSKDATIKEIMSASMVAAPRARGASLWSVERYSPQRKELWDFFVGRATNATFLFHRDYMDYHRDRFQDHSLMVFRAGELVAVLPANLASDGALVSHDGLTYGGLATSPELTLAKAASCFHLALCHLHSLGISSLRYKRMPSFYNTRADGDIAYCLFMLKAELYRRDCSLAVPLANRLPLQKRRKRQAIKAQRVGLRVIEESQFQSFWDEVLAPRLMTRYGVKPVHTLAEITLLAAHFPEQIRQFSVYDRERIIAGITVYETPSVAHAQYIAATDAGRQFGALDLLVTWLLDERYKNKRFFDFGGSNEQGGGGLNHGLLAWKEGFGARVFAHDFYELRTANYPLLEPVFRAHSRPRSQSQDQYSALTDRVSDLLQ
jgi:hypothetical protein